MEYKFLVNNKNDIERLLNKKGLKGKWVDEILIVSADNEDRIFDIFMDNKIAFTRKNN